MKQNTEKLKKKLDTDIEDLNSRLTADQNEIAKLNKAIKDKDVSLKMFKGILSENESIETTAKLSHQQLLQELTGLKEQLEKAKLGNASLENEKNSLNNGLHELRDELESATNNKVKLEKLIRDLEYKSNELNEEVEEKENTSELEEIKRKHQEEINELRSRIDVEAEARSKAENVSKAVAKELEEVKSKFETADQSRQSLNKSINTRTLR
eukprot:TRINITY_DN334_c0_g1_i1.p2 TRINITY_DN334_c0_g1~~TRINITY_DN334_c0_g1_i1.p2  ORF type:complete len:211 (-),score=112.45 TRINITY_DN334_c0_g1_i1:67-699(-)